MGLIKRDENGEGIGLMVAMVEDGLLCCMWRVSRPGKSNVPSPGGFAAASLATGSYTGENRTLGLLIWPHGRHDNHVSTGVLSLRHLVPDQLLLIT